jgi:release factor glutamine methyltransferase
MSSPTESVRWTTRKLLAWTTEHFEKKGIDSPRLSAEMLLARVLGVQRIKLFMDADRPASELERAAFRELVERASKHEPVDYLVGHAPFFSMMIKVTPAVLIPRPSTETVVEHVIQHSRRTPGFRAPVIADICTGSGIIAIALAKHIEGAALIATDISEQALAIARENAAALGVAARIDFRHGDLLAPLKFERVKYLVSNPPYISDAEFAAVLPNVKDYEPHLALRGGSDGLMFIRPLLEAARDHIEAPGQAVIEIADSQKDIAIALAEEAGLENPHVLADHECLPRVLVADVS